MDPLAYLLGLETLGIKFGLENIRTLAASLDHPERAYATVHVAGTNGKGSTTAMIERALRASGRRTGRYTSPHLGRLEERFVVDGERITQEELRELAALLRARVESLMAAGSLAAPPTFFEVTTAIAFEWFRRRGVEIGVIEVGLGGRLDATNIIDPLVTAITSIAVDHERLLGPTIPDIAREKAGIIKPGVPMVVGPVDEQAGQAIAAIAGREDAPLVRALDGVTSEVALDDEGRSLVTLETPRRRYGRLRLALRGRHQVHNAVVAVRVLEALEDRGVPVSSDAVRGGLEKVVWPGRLDLRRWPGGRAALFDAAHNPAGAAALADYLRVFAPGRVPLVFGAMADKDYEGMLRVLEPFVGRLVATRPAMRRAADPPDIARAARTIGFAAVCEEERPQAAIDEAWREDPLIVVTGSTFLVGELLPSDATG
jgi:dihydrofolate synthase/folylpolyglutamate synthase